MRIDIYYPSYLCILIWYLKQSAFENLLHTFSYPYRWTMQWHLPTLGAQMYIVIRFCEAFLLYNSIFIRLLPHVRRKGSYGWKEPLCVSRVNKDGADWRWHLPPADSQGGSHLLGQMGGSAPLWAVVISEGAPGRPSPSPVLSPSTWGGLILQHLHSGSWTGTLSLPVSEPEVLRDGS